MFAVQRFAIVVALAALVAGFATGQEAHAKALKVGHSTWVGYGPFFVAQEKGYYKEEGVDIELVNIEDVKLRFAALIAGQIDAMATTVDTMLQYLKPGTSFQYVFAVDDSKGGDGVVADKEIKTVADLKGKKVAFTEGSVSQFYVNVLLREAGLSQSDIEVINMTAGDAGSAFVSGQVNAAVTWEPWLTRGKQAPHGHLLTDSSTQPGLITDIVLAPNAIIESRGAELKAFYRAWTRAVDFWKTNPKEANAIMAKGVGGWLKDPDVFADTLTGIVYYDDAMNKAFFGTSGAAGPMYQTVQNALDIWNSFGKLQVQVTPKDVVNHGVVHQ